MRRIIEKTLLKLFPAALLEHMVFEWKSFVGRIFTKDLNIESRKPNYINLGCGNIYVEGMINIDFFSATKSDYGLDLRFPFRIATESIDGLSSEHTFEHLSYEEVANALSECYRILKPGAVIRIILPDLSILVDKYQQGDNAWFGQWKDVMLADASRAHMRKNFTKMFALCFTASYYHHKSCWDFETIKEYLNDAGFTEVQRLGFMQGTAPLLIDTDKGGRRLVSIYIEAIKPI